MPPLGPIASFNKNLLSEENQALMQWHADYTRAASETDLKMFVSMMEAAACYLPNHTFWHVVATVKDVIENKPDLVDKVKEQYGINQKGPVS